MAPDGTFDATTAKSHLPPSVGDLIDDCIIKARKDSTSNKPSFIPKWPRFILPVMPDVRVFIPGSFYRF